MHCLLSVASQNNTLLNKQTSKTNNKHRQENKNKHLNKQTRKQNKAKKINLFLYMTSISVHFSDFAFGFNSAIFTTTF